ncbi:LAGLIDADG endonuclease [Pyrenophora seminiperda CCB06]|uniref:LAGLIDADG endonuclease (Mitochondrion) n=1 Tax=Pyrenophora seminiperda CCB06 TaxID=1302712 RepID=A0A3M7M5K9_9PLEO|nr:LAGLIDADG endonuclease [Pyrenophora seminiperda CCB06]
MRQILYILKEEPRLSEKGFNKILNLRYNLNLGMSEELKVLYPDLIPVPRPEVPEGVIHPQLLVGFVDGEGSFNVVTVEKMSNAASTLSTTYKV